MTTVILFVFGLVIGSFLNVLGLRWNSGLSFGGRSFCPICGNKLRWFELIPVLSFVFLFGRCRHCAVKISWQYPAVEILTGLVFVSVFLAISPDSWFSFFYLVSILLIFSIYIVISIYDLRHKIIPDNLVYPVIVISLLVSYFFHSRNFILLDWLSGPILFSFIALIWFFSGGRAMGFGDAKLSLSIGLFLGASAGFSALVLAFWIGAVVSLVHILLGKLGFLKDGKKLTMKSELPMAPFLALGAWFGYIFNLDLLHVGLF